MGQDRIQLAKFFVVVVDFLRELYSEEIRRLVMSEIGAVLAWLYGAVAFYYTICFEFAIFQQEGFLAWLIFGSWLAPILGLLWPFTTGALS